MTILSFPEGSILGERQNNIKEVIPEADGLLREFVEVSLIVDDEEQCRKFNILSQAIFSYVRKTG